MTTTIYHLIARDAWERVRHATEYRAESLETEGFIHCSGDLEQLLRVADRLYAGREDLLALKVDTRRLTSAVKWEPARSGEVYPHIYGPLSTGAVVEVRTLAVDNNGAHILEKA